MITQLRTPSRAAAALLALLATAPAVLATGGPAQEKDKDTIQFKDGKTEPGLIKSEEYAGITFNPAKGPARTVEWKEVAPNGITYAGSPEYQAAKDMLDSGKLAEALPLFEELLTDAKLRAVLKQNAEYYVAAIHQRTGDFDKAIEGYKKLVADFPKSRYLMEVGENLVASYAGKGDLAPAGKALDELSSAATSAGVEASFNSAVNVLKGRLLEEQKKYPEAQAAYGVAESATGVPQSVVQQARLGKARCMVALNKKSEAEQLLRAIVKEDASNAVLAGAWNGLGDITLEEGKKGSGDSEKLLDALFCYLRGVVQYAPLPGEPVTEYKRAMKNSAQVCEFISQVEKNPDRKRVYKLRAQERADQYKKEFPDG